MDGGARLQRLGRWSWSLLGIIAVVLVVATGVSAISGIVVPLVIAVILGTVLDPLVGWLGRRGVPRTLGTVLALLVALMVALGMVVLVVVGLIQQLPEISRELRLGWESVVAWGRSLELDPIWFERLRAAFDDYAPYLGQGVVGALGSTLSGLISFSIGAFFAIFLLFFVLRDSQRFPPWLAARINLDPQLAQQLADEAKRSIRGYFRGIGVTALITAPVFMVPLLVLQIPLAVPIFIIYFFLSFIPYVGAWLTGAFAVLIAFGTGGPTAALIVAVSLLVSNGTIQSVVSSWALGSSLKLHPVTVLLATIVGGTIAGMLGMVLAAPLVAAVSRSMAVVRAHREPTDPVAPEAAVT